MKELLNLDFDVNKCKKELKEFGALLHKHKTLSERKTILPFFKRRKHLGAFIGFHHSGNTKLDRFATEFGFFGNYRCDLISGDSNTKSYCVVEFEDAKPNSIFSKRGRDSSYWANRIEDGFSQIVDWFWTLSDFKKTDNFRDTFGDTEADFIALIVIGRNRFLKRTSDKTRFRWRSKNISVNNIKVTCMTYDELYKAMCERIKALNTDEDNDFEPIQD